MTYVVVSGLPGSGKSTVARRLAAHTGLAVLDTDDILEQLFDERGVGDAAWRSALSREADHVFAELASGRGSACLVSWWRHPRSMTDSGTPTEWLTALPSHVVEVHCVCPVDVAVDRFLRRTRHPGHQDASKSRDSVTRQFEALAALGPLGIGPGIEVTTTDDVDLKPVMAWFAAQESERQ